MKSRGAISRPWLRLALVALAGLLVSISWIVLRKGDAPARPDTTPPAAASIATAPSTEAGNAGSGAAATEQAPETPATVTAPPATAGTTTDPAANAPSQATQPAVAGLGSAAPMSAATPKGGEAEKRLAPKDWRMCFPNAGGAPDSYELVADSSTPSGGSWSARLQSTVARPTPSGAAICQTLSAATWRGQRLEVSLQIRTESAMPGAHMVFRADDAAGRVVAFYNMAPHWVLGTRDWAEYSAVIDVPESASVIVVGAALVNTGKLWIDNCSMSVAGPDVALTVPPMKPGPYNQVIDPTQLPRGVQNGGFEQTFELPRRD